MTGSNQRLKNSKDSSEHEVMCNERVYFLLLLYVKVYYFNMLSLPDNTLLHG